MPCYIFAVISLMGCTRDDMSPGSGWTQGTIPQPVPSHVWIPRSNPRARTWASVSYTEQCSHQAARGEGPRQSFSISQWGYGISRVKEKLNSMGFNILPFPPSTAQSKVLNPKQACAHWAMVLLSKSLKDRKYIQYQEFLLRKKKASRISLQSAVLALPQH